MSFQDRINEIIYNMKKKRKKDKAFTFCAQTPAANILPKSPPRNMRLLYDLQNKPNNFLF